MIELNGFLAQLCPILSVEKIRQIARETGFFQRQPKKISPEALLECFCCESIKGTLSFNDLAFSFALSEDTSASRQAFHKRLNDNCVLFFQRILETVMNEKLGGKHMEQLSCSHRVKRILVQDSTVVRLPLKLFDDYSGVKNAHAAVCNARIQGTFELISGRFIAFSIDPYKMNDISVANEIPTMEGDLVLRDRGYISASSVADTINNKKADLVARYKHKTCLFDTETNEEINLLKELQKYGFIDKTVWFGNKKKVKVRLVAVAVNQETANIRRMRAKKEHSGSPPSKELLLLMSWTIFITTLSKEEFDFKSLFLIYGLRWRIECIFKTWKSNLAFAKIHNVSKNQLIVLLTARFIMVCLCYERLFFL